MTFWETIERGEYVMFALAAVLIVIICVWWIRSAALAKQKKKYSPLMHRIRDHVMEGDIENARQICEASDTPGARVAEAGLSRIGHPMAEVKSAIKDVSNIEKKRMSRGCRWLRALAVISPLLGLGGTLTGIIDRLRDLGESGVAVDIASVCGAIAPTIVTTVAGLGVGIFSLISLTCLEGTVFKARLRLDKIGKEICDLLNEPS